MIGSLGLASERLVSSCTRLTGRVGLNLQRCRMSQVVQVSLKLLAAALALLVGAWPLASNRLRRVNGPGTMTTFVPES